MATNSTAENQDAPESIAQAEDGTEELMWHGGAAPTDEDVDEAMAGESLATTLANADNADEIPLESDRRGEDEESPRHGDSLDKNYASAGLGGVGEGSTR